MNNLILQLLLIVLITLAMIFGWSYTDTRIEENIFFLVSVLVTVGYLNFLSYKVTNMKKDIKNEN